MELGGTGEYPKGKLNEDDEGELRLKVGFDESGTRILIEFGKSVSWVGMDAEDAIGLAKVLIGKAKMLSPRGFQLDWQKAIDHFRNVRGSYQELGGTPGVNTSAALEMVFLPLAERYFKGERTEELYRAMIDIE